MPKQSLKNDLIDDLFKEGDLAMLIDRKGRRYMITLTVGSEFHSHLGYIEHNNILGRKQGEWCKTTKGHILLILKPTLSDYVLNMKRETQVIYPKDIGLIIMLADIFPGAKVVEAGFGSGALTLGLLRSTGNSGSVTSYELRMNQATKALKNISPFMKDMDNLTIKYGDIYEQLDETNVDRLVLDVPEPWNVVPHATSILLPGGIFLSFLPTVLQVHKLVEELTNQTSFQLIETIETLLRPWHVTQKSMRPTHRMVAHTGFITTARLCSPRPR